MSPNVRAVGHRILASLMLRTKSDRLGDICSREQEIMDDEPENRE